MSSAKLQKIKFIDVPVENYYSGTTKFDESLFCEYYLSFILHDDVFSVDDVVLVNGNTKIEVVRILCIFNVEKIASYIVARKYLFARNLKDKLVNLGFVEFDEDSEVVEDRTKDYVIQANQVVKKCGLVYAHLDDSPYIIKENNLTCSDFFSCRYYLKSYGICPVLSQNTILSDNFRSSDTKLGNAKKSKSKGGVENTPLTYLVNSDNTSTGNVLKIKMKSPNIHKNKVSPYRPSVCSPVHINSVKRNLNESFGNSPIKSNNSILNYSIISDDEIESKPLVLRLKKSQKNKVKVALKKVNDDNSQLNKIQHTIKTVTPLRKSNRVKVRKSYADYISPVKTPTKRKLIRKKSESDVTSEDDINFEYNTPVKNTPCRRNQKLKEESLETPKKSIRPEDSELGKRIRRTPRARIYQEHIDMPNLKENNSVGSARKSMKFTNNLNIVKVTNTSGSSTRKNKRLNSTSLVSEENKKNIEVTPEKRLNLDESIRRQILRVHLTESNVGEETNNNQQKNKRKSVANQKFYYESSESEETPRKVKWDNLDDLVRRQILKVRLSQLEFEGTGKTRNLENPQKYKCKSRSVKKHESSSEDEKSSENLDWDNLDDSMTRQILKIHLTRCESEGTGEMRNLENPQKCKCKSRSVTQHEFSSEDEESSENLNWNTLDDSVRWKILKIYLNQCESKERLEINGNLQKDIHKSRTTIKYETPPENITCSSPIKSGTPRTKMKSVKPTCISSDSSDSEDVQPITPKTKRYISKATPKSTTKQTPKITKTPKNRAKLIRDGIITPTMHSRSKAVPGESTPLMKARSKLHVSYVPTALPCREKEYCDIFNFLEGKLLDGCGGCIYISGVPGTGKTATVTSVINNLLQNDDVPKFSYVNINGMRLSEPRQAYVEILKQLTGKTVQWEQAQTLLEEKFTKSKNFTPLVMLIDELDILCTKRQDVVYNLLDWPSKAKNQLIVITIANTMDLPERLLMSRVTSRLGLTRLSFQAYTHKQLQEIVIKRLTGTDSFNPDAVQFVARKVASVSGDARRALDICRRAAEIAEVEGKSQLVGMNHVNEALNAMITQPKVRAIKNCSRLEQLILQSIVAEVERTGVEETTFADVFKMLVSCAAIEGFQMVSSTNALAAISRLSACRLILSDQKCSNINQRIILNVSADDVYYALRHD